MPLRRFRSMRKVFHLDQQQLGRLQHYNNVHRQGYGGLRVFCIRLLGKMTNNNSKTCTRIFSHQNTRICL